MWCTFQNLKIIGTRLQEMSQLALKAKDVRSALDGMVPPGFLKQLRENVKGTVNDFTLMQKSVEAIDLGATNEQIQIFAKFARLEALRKGGDSAARFGEIISGVLRGSTELLDNFGINLTDLNKKIVELSGGKALTALERRSLSVEAAVKIMNERMNAFGDIALSDAEKSQQFAVTLQNAKVLGGQFLNLFLMPLMELATPILNFFTSLDKKTAMMVGTIGIVIATLWKLIPALKAVGITSKFALGPIGLIIAALELLYMAYKTNFLGIGDAVKVTWEYLKGFWEFLKNWANSIGETFVGLGKMIWGTMTFNWGKINVGWNELAGSIKTSWNDAFQDIKENVKRSLEAPEAGSIVQKFGKLGNAAGVAFAVGVDEGQEIYKKVNKKTLADELAEKWGTIESIFTKKKVSENPLSSFNQAAKDYKETLAETGITAQNTFNVIANGMDQVSRGIVDAMWGAKVKFKEIWIGIAKDFTKLFVDEILKIVAKKLVVKLVEMLALFDKASNDRMAVRIGRDYARLFTKGVFDYMDTGALTAALAVPGGGRFSDANIVRALNTSNNRLRSIENKLINQNGTNININIDEDAIYRTVKNANTIEKIRRGNEINSANLSRDIFLVATGKRDV